MATDSRTIFIYSRTIERHRKVIALARLRGVVWWQPTTYPVRHCIALTAPLDELYSFRFALHPAHPLRL